MAPFCILLDGILILLYTKISKVGSVGDSEKEPVPDDRPGYSVGIAHGIAYLCTMKACTYIAGLAEVLWGC